MPIAALPPSAVRSIGSTTAISDSVSVVKELVDNALDARASSVAVEISVNALDVIQVKDNGHGIAPADRDLVCHRHCTSKVRDFDDVMDIGGTSLGFRGEALASIAEMSGSMVISTRIEGEPVATSLKIGREGDIVSQDRISHPLGTTVRVVDLVKHLPVRRERALQMSARVHSKIKSTLQAYALARPTVRFSLKILKAKNDKGNWMYVPKAASDTLWDAAMKIFDSRAITQCHLRCWTSSDQNSSHDAAGSIRGLPSQGPLRYTIEAIIPRPQSETSAVNRIGPFVSVDSRPVSCARGTLKSCLDLYKSYLRSSTSSESLVNPLICMNIACSQGAYDANIEPAKDDVLFTDGKGFLSEVEGFFRDAYGELGNISAGEGPAKEQNGNQNGFELLLNRTPCASLATTTEVTSNAGLSNGNVARPGETTQQEHSASNLAMPPRSAVGMNVSLPLKLGTGVSNQEDLDPISTEGTIWQSNMSSGKDDFFGLQDFTHSGSTTGLGNEEAEALRDVHVSNPWTIAKVNAPIRRLPAYGEPSTTTYHNGQLFTPARQRGELGDLGRFFGRGSNSSRKSSPSNVPLVNQSSSREFSADEQGSPLDQFTFPLRGWRPKGRRSDTSNGLDTTPESSPERPLDRWIRRDQITPQYNAPPQAFTTGTPLGDIPQIARRPRKVTPRKPQHEKASITQPFKPPLLDANRIRLSPEAVRRPLSSRAAQMPLSWTNRTATIQLQQESEDIESIYSERFNEATSPTPAHPDLATTLDYERRKQAAIQQRQRYMLQRAQAIRSEATSIALSPKELAIPPPSNSPYRNRYNKALAALNPPKDPTTASDPILQPSVFQKGDPRAYFFRHQQEQQNLAPEAKENRETPMRKLKRAKTSLLPLESTPVDATLYNLVFKLDVDAEQILSEMAALANTDNYVRLGTENVGLAQEVKDIEYWEQRICEIIETKYRRDDGSEVKEREVKVKMNFNPSAA